MYPYIISYITYLCYVPIYYEYYTIGIPKYLCIVSRYLYVVVHNVRVLYCTYTYVHTRRYIVTNRLFRT